MRNVIKSVGLVTWILLGFLGLESISRAEPPSSLIIPVWAATDLDTAVAVELASLQARKSAVIQAYNDLGTKLSTYDGWCNTYGISALRSVLEGGLFRKFFSVTGFAAYHVYANDPYFSRVRGAVDKAIQQTRNVGFDVGKCLLSGREATKMSRDPKQFDRAADERAVGASEAYLLLTGNLRLIDEEREILLELKGMIAGTGHANDSRAVESFVKSNYGRLADRTRELRERTLKGYEYGFRVPLGELELYRGKRIGFQATDAAPNFFWIFERRAYYVNQARLAAGTLFEQSVKNFVAAETLQQRFLSILREAAGR